MKKQFFYLFIATVMVGIGLTSCLKDDNGDGNDSSIISYFTIKGTFPDNQLVSDNGFIVIPTRESLIKVTNNKGFGNFKRAVLSIVYNGVNMTTDEVTKTTTIKYATIVNGQLIPSVNPIEAKTAAEKKITVADSLFEIKKLEQSWGSVTGYLSTVVQSEYYINKKRVPVAPTFNVVYDKADMKENELKLTFCSNQHRSKGDNNVNISKFTTSFFIKDILAQVPGTDSVKVTLSGQGFEPKVIKFGRNIK